MYYIHTYLHSLHGTQHKHVCMYVYMNDNVITLFINAIVVTGALAQAFTVDGTKFKDSDNEYLDPCQDIEITPSGLYGIVVREP